MMYKTKEKAISHRRDLHETQQSHQPAEDEADSDELLTDDRSAVRSLLDRHGVQDEDVQHAHHHDQQVDDVPDDFEEA